MLLKAIGMANLRIFLPRGPFSISIFVFDAPMYYLENGRKFSFLNFGNKKGLYWQTSKKKDIFQKSL
jgi:hypothetical protein